MAEINLLRKEISETNRRLGALTVEKGVSLSTPVDLPLHDIVSMEEFERWLLVDNNLKNMVIY